MPPAEYVTPRASELPEYPQTIHTALLLADQAVALVRDRHRARLTLNGLIIDPAGGELSVHPTFAVGHRRIALAGQHFATEVEILQAKGPYGAIWTVPFNLRAPVCIGQERWYNVRSSAVRNIAGRVIDTLMYPQAGVPPMFFGAWGLPSRSFAHAAEKWFHLVEDEYSSGEDSLNLAPFLIDGLRRASGLLSGPQSLPRINQPGTLPDEMYGPSD